MGSLCTSESKTREQVVNSKGALECERRRVSIQQQQQKKKSEGDQDFSSLEDSEPRGSNASGCGTTSDDELSPTTTTSPSDHQQRPMKYPESPPAAPQTAPPVNGSSDEDFGSRRILKHQQQQPHLTQRKNSTDTEGRGGSGGGSGEGSRGSSGSEGEGGGGGTGGSGSGSGSNGVTRSGSGGDSGSGGERGGSRRTPTSPTTESNSNSAELLHRNHVQLFGDESLKMLHRLGIAQSNADLDSTGSPNPTSGSATGSDHLVQGAHASSSGSSPLLESSEDSLIAIKPARPYADGPRGGHNLEGGAPSAIRSLVSDTSRSRRQEQQQQQQQQQHPSSSSDTMVPEKIVLPVPPALFPVAALVRDNDQHVSSAVQRRVANWQDDVE